MVFKISLKLTTLLIISHLCTLSNTSRRAKMYNLPPFCCICFNNKEELKSINNKECMETQILSKLNFCSFETDWIIPDFPIYICRKCCHILDIACDFKNMCIKSNSVLRGYVNQLKSASNSVDNIRNELFTMFNNSDKHLEPEPVKMTQLHTLTPQKIDAGPSTKQHNLTYQRQMSNLKDDQIKIKTEAEELLNYNRLNKIIKHPGDKTDKITVDNSVMSFCDIKSEFSDLANCSTPVESIIHSDTFNFELKQNGAHQCSLCHKCFSRESVLTRHMLIHSGQRPHHCNICNKNFTHKFNLKQHLLIHSGHKSHHCTVCDKGFIKKSDLDRHMLTHFGERIHHCSLCSKSFVRKENLNQHILTHTGQKPHHCTQCTKSFLRKSDLNRHTLLCISKRS